MTPALKWESGDATPQYTHKVAVLFPRLPRNGDGWWQCRKCRKPIANGPRYRAWCSQECERSAVTLAYWGWATRARLRVDHYKCQKCGHTAAEVHHKIRVLDGGTNAQENLISLCKQCHTATHVAERQRLKAQNSAPLYEKRVKPKQATIAEAKA